MYLALLEQLCLLTAETSVSPGELFLERLQERELHAESGCDFHIGWKVRTDCKSQSKGRIASVLSARRVLVY
jgi:hypothetical protein